ncbi:type II secretion system protein [Candidatus Dojkabacteria bacterium]|nr:type II secretion system protein [Candidatus Dojkabacteria bacterium]
MKKATKAFTFLELMIVLVIIGILTMGVTLAAGYGMKLARDSRRKKNVDNLAGLMQAYYNDNIKYPVDADMTVMIGSSGALTSFMEGVFDGTPCKGDAMNNCYSYATDSVQHYYAICTCLELKAPSDGKCTSLDQCYCQGNGNSSLLTTACLASKTQ